jgi:hypothetical protein
LLLLRGLADRSLLLLLLGLSGISLCASYGLQAPACHVAVLEVLERVLSCWLLHRCCLLLLLLLLLLHVWQPVSCLVDRVCIRNQARVNPHQSIQACTSSSTQPSAYSHGCTTRNKPCTDCYCNCSSCC